MLRAVMTQEQLDEQIAEEEQYAARRMVDFIGKAQFKPARSIVKLIEETAAQTIQACARTERGDLIFIGTRGHPALASFSRQAHRALVPG